MTTPDWKAIDRCKNPKKVIGIITLVTFAVCGTKELCKAAANSIIEWNKRRTNKKHAKQMTELENLKFEHRKAERAEREEYARRRRQEYKSSQNQEATPEEVHTPKGRSLDDQLRNVGARLKCLVEGLIELGGFIVLLGKEKIGKSTFLMQLAIDIAKGAYFEFISQNEQKTHSPLKVLYIDLEMKIRELKERLKNIAIPTNLLWESEINSIGSLISYIRENIKGCTECVVILDNLKKMAERSTNHHEVNDIFRALQKLQKELSQEGITLTIIVANHTVKGYNPYKPISTSDAASSVEISQFSTGVIALAPAKDGNTMIKKVSSRNFPTDDTVLVVKMVKEPYQHFKYVKTCSEAEALPIETKASKASTPGKTDDVGQFEKRMKAAGLNETQIKHVLELDDEIDRIKLLLSFNPNPKLTQEEIGEIMGRRRETINRKLNENCSEAK